MNNYTEQERAFGESCNFCKNMFEIFDPKVVDKYGRVDRHAECKLYSDFTVNKELGRCDLFKLAGGMVRI